MRFRNFLSDLAKLFRFFASVRSRQARWNLAQSGEKQFWESFEPFLYGWTEHFQKFGFMISMNLKAAISDTNSVSYRDLFRILGFDIPDPNPIVADVGSGTSGMGYAIRDASVVCLDPLIDVYNKISFYRENIFKRIRDKMMCKCVGEMLPLSDESLDAVFCLNVLDHCKDPQAVLEEISRALVDGGILILYLNVWIGRRPFVIDTLHPNAMSLRELSELIEKDFSVALKREVTKTYPGHLLSRILIGLQSPLGKIQYGEVFHILKKKHVARTRVEGNFLRRGRFVC